MATPDRREDKHWTELSPTRHYSTRMYVALGIAALWEILALTLGRLLLTDGIGGKIGFVLLLLLGLVPLVEVARSWMVFRNFYDARVFVNRREMALGYPFEARVRQKIRRAIHLREMRIALVCTEITPHAAAGSRSRTRAVVRLQKWETITREKTAEDDKVLSATRTFQIPAEQPASTPSGRKKPPTIQWKLRLLATPEHGLAYDVDFPIKVRALPSHELLRQMAIELTPPGARP